LEEEDTRRTQQATAVSEKNENFNLLTYIKLLNVKTEAPQHEFIVQEIFF
jgi:hypothetical protein